jgi:hypothetical protein
MVRATALDLVTVGRFGFHPAAGFSRNSITGLSQLEHVAHPTILSVSERGISLLTDALPLTILSVLRLYRQNATVR